MPPDIQRGMYVLHFTCHFCGAFYHAAQLLHAVGIRRRIRCHETLTCFHIIIFPCALSCTHSRKPLTRKHNLKVCLWPACSAKKVVTVTSDLPRLPGAPRAAAPCCSAPDARCRGLAGTFCPLAQLGILALAVYSIMMKDTSGLTATENLRQVSAPSSANEIKTLLNISRTPHWGPDQR